MMEALSHVDRAFIPEARMHSKGWRSFAAFTASHDIRQFTNRPTRVASAGGSS
jgi:catalase